MAYVCFDDDVEQAPLSYTLSGNILSILTYSKDPKYMLSRLQARYSKHSKSCFILLFLATAVFTNYAHHAALAKLDLTYTEDRGRTWLPSPEDASLWSFGYNQLLADVYWLAFVQYIGDPKMIISDRLQYAFPYLNLITRLDPHFLCPYWFAAFTLGSDLGQPDLAHKIICYGMDNNKDNWYLPFIAGINQYLFAKNELLAAKYYRRAAKYPNAPPWLERQAKILESKIPSQVKEIKTWKAILKTEKNAMVRAAVQKKLIQLWLRIYYQAPPTSNIRQTAANELKRLGVEPPSLN